MASYPFQQYGMLDGQVMNISADASESNTPSTSDKNGAQKTQPPTGQVYKALISLDAQQLRAHNKGYKLVPGMQVVAEINEGQRSVMRYLLSPLQKTVQESGRER